MEWKAWPTDDSDLAKAAGVSFDRTPAGRIVAPPGMIRVCAYHIDFYERPTWSVDVATHAEAIAICDDLPSCSPGNVDFAMAWDDNGAHLAGGPY